MSNLVPLSKSPLIKKQTSSIIKTGSFSSGTGNIGSNVINKNIKTNDKSLLETYKKVIKIDNILKKILKFKTTQSKKEKSSAEKKQFEKREKQLEKKNQPKEKSKINLPSGPKMGFLDWIKNFLLNTFLGFISIRLIDFLPQLMKILPTIIRAGEFLIDWGGKLLDGLVTFIDWGYKAYDGTRGFLKNLGGEGLAKNFDKFSGAIGNIIDVLILASIATMGMDSGDGGAGGRGGRRGFDSQGRRVGKDVQKRYAQRYGKDQFLDRFGKKNLKNLTGGARRGIFQKGARSAFMGLAGKGGAKTILKFVKPLVNKIPIIGGLIEFGLSWALGEPVGKAAFRGIGAVLVGAIGTAIGGPIGAFLGSWAGGEAGGLLYDMFFNNKKPQKGKVAKAAGGGKPSTRGGKLVGGPAKRTIKRKKAPRTLTTPPTKLKPGSVVGGEKKIKELYPESKDKTKMSPFDFIKSTYERLSRSKGLERVASLGLKPIMGDRLNYADFKGAATVINNWMNQTMTPETLAYAGGGEVKMEQVISGEDYSNVIAKSLQESVAPESEKIIQDLMKQLMLKKVEPDIKDQKKAPDAEDMGEGAGIQVSSDSEDFWLLATAAMFENSNPQGAADVAQVIYNRTQYPAWNASTIRKAILNPGQFQPVRQYGGTAAWASIKTKEDALRFSRSHGKTQEQLERVAAALLDKQKQQDARQFVGPRDSFRSDSYEAANNHLANETEKSRHGHTFGFEPGGALIGQFKAGKLSAAQVNAGITGNVSFNGGDGRFIQGNSGRSGGTHFHIGTTKPGDSSGVANAGFQTIKHFLGKKSIFVGRSNETIPANATDEQIKGYIGRGQAAHRQTELDLQIGGLGAGNKVAFPLALKGMKYSATDGYGVSADIVGVNAFVGHGRYKPDGSLAAQQKLVLNAGAPDFYAFHGMHRLMTKDGLLKFHKGEFVSIMDEDTGKLARPILLELNGIENKSQLIAKAPSIIEKLKAISNYTEDDMPTRTVIVEVPVPQIVPISSGSKSIIAAGGRREDIDNIGEILDVVG